jgi:hypothetical protein
MSEKVLRVRCIEIGEVDFRVGAGFPLPPGMPGCFWASIADLMSALPPKDGVIGRRSVDS